MRYFSFIHLFLIINFSYSQNTFIPDDNFEQVLIDLGYDSGTLDDFVLTENIEDVTILNIANTGILDLTGIEDFRALTNLDARGNLLEEINLRSNLELQVLQLDNNFLRALNVSKNIRLRFLFASFNELTDVILMEPNGIFTDIFLNNNLLSNNDLLNNLARFSELSQVQISHNKFEGDLPDFSLTKLVDLRMNDNAFQFGDFEDEHAYYFSNLGIYIYSPQAKVDNEEVFNLDTGDNIIFITNCRGTENNYQWFKDGVPLNDSGTYSGTQTARLSLNNVQNSDSGIYYCEVTSDIVNDLTILRNNIELKVSGIGIPCTLLINPSNRESNVPLSASLTWQSIESATNYRLTIGTSPGATDVLNNESIGNTTTYIPRVNWQENTTYYVTVTPENEITSALGCTQTSFTTIRDEASNQDIPNFFTPNNDQVNDYWQVKNINSSVKVIYIYDRFGKLLHILDPLSQGWDGTYAGKKMPSTDYWYQIEFLDGRIVNGHFSLIQR